MRIARSAFDRRSRTLDDAATERREATVNACEIVTTADVQQALGQPVGEGTSAPQNTPNICNFTAADGKVVSTVLYEQGGAAMLPMMMPQPTEVPGLGDKAAWYGMGRIFGVLKGDTLLTIQFVGFTEPDTQTLERARAIAQGAVGRF
jgi:hypothetical protein